MSYRRFALILLLIFLVIMGGTVGFQIIEGWPFLDAFYMTVITISTVGFQEVAALSPAGKVFTIVLILTGIAVITTGVGFIFSTVIEGTFGEIMRRQSMEKKLAKIKDHFIICGSGAVGEDVVSEFIHAKAPFVLIDKEAATIDLRLKEFPKILYVIGDATDDEILKAANIDEARGIVAVLGNDADNLYICLTARSLNPRLRIIARAIEGEAISKLKKAGADYVFSPEKIGGVRLAAAALRPSVTSFLDAILKGHHLNLILDEVEVQNNSLIAGKTLKEAEISKNIGIIVLAVKAADLDKLTFNPVSDTVIKPGDHLIAFGSTDQITKLQKICSTSIKII
jgi:voltage-gated potassium channel